MEYSQYHTQITISSNNTDCFGRILPKILSQIVSDVANAHTTQLGVDRLTLNAENITWMLHSVHIKIDEMPMQGDVLHITTYPAGLDRLFALRCYEIDNDKGTSLVKISTRWMLIDLNKRRPIRPTPRIIALNSGLTLPPYMPQNTLSARNMPTSFTETHLFDATFDNIDFNGHVTQSTYIMWLTNSLPFQFHKTHSLVEAELIYEHEIMPENTVRALINQSDNNELVTIYHKLIATGNDTEHCIARTIWKKR